MTIMEWVRSVKPDLVRLQLDKGIPATFAAAQFCHESYSGGGLSTLAREARNFAGLKFSSWQTAYGCKPVTYGTWEHIDGQDVALDDAFCWCPSWEVWLQVYGDLLTGSFYGPALTYKHDPMLYAYHVWRRGWASDPAYMLGIAKWMTALWPDYADTLPGGVYKPVPVYVGGAEVPCNARLELGRTRMDLRPVVEALGATVQWVAPEQGGPRVNITKTCGGGCK